MQSRKFIIGGLIIFAGLAFLGYMALEKSVVYYYTVTELVDQGDLIYNQNVRVSGVVIPDTVEWGAEDLTIEFILTDGKERLPVVYRGVVPQTFGEAREVVIEGEYKPPGMFEASNILTRCSAKYVPENLDSGEK